MGEQLQIKYRFEYEATWVKIFAGGLKDNLLRNIEEICSKYIKILNTWFEKNFLLLLNVSWY